MFSVRGSYYPTKNSELKVAIDIKLREAELLIANLKVAIEWKKLQLEKREVPLLMIPVL